MSGTSFYVQPVFVHTNNNLEDEESKEKSVLVYCREEKEIMHMF